MFVFWRRHKRKMVQGDHGEQRLIAPQDSRAAFDGRGSAPFIKDTKTHGVEMETYSQPSEAPSGIREPQELSAETPEADADAEAVKTRRQISISV